MRVEVDEGSKPSVEGVTSALRFCVIISSTEARDIRRKSLSATVEKQNCGVNVCGNETGSAIVSRRALFATSALEVVDQNQFASVKMIRSLFLLCEVYG